MSAHKWHNFLSITKHLLFQTKHIGCLIDTIFSPLPIFKIIPIGSQWMHKNINFLPLLNTKGDHLLVGGKNTQSHMFQSKHLIMGYNLNASRVIHQTLINMFPILLLHLVTKCCSIMGISTLYPRCAMLGSWCAWWRVIIMLFSLQWGVNSRG
jgi:hypothetical protein